MARYIDADKLIEHIKDEIKACEPVFDGRANGKSVAYGTELGLKAAISFAETLATADVAPKSEVEKEIKNWQELYADTVSKWEKAYEELEIKLENAKAEVATEIFEEIEHEMFMCDPDYGWLYHKFNELKKKYTGEVEGDG